ncbi:CGNR zinc finger domain-containing protein [Streptomyces pactum]|uniref:CGNR zinc finger domain-containing protein n=1 Tax=Streptomyces pactum TaxID=68249 RepID=A0ABS0NI67_9ACTN|nr:CGNR zinc finger domain-containing protein [Streptomyces pactum]MBH5334861.1 CGNR zinc finger domain-containing protein [Streptomyces pactum]
MPPAGPRPLLGEPVSLDLLNTEWIAQGVRQDLLTSVEGLHVWLADNGLEHLVTGGTPGDSAPHGAAAPSGGAVLEALLEAREAIGAAVRAPGTEDAVRRVNAVLRHGRVRPLLTGDGPGEAVEFDDPAWGPAWTAAHDYLRLLRTAPDRIRACEHPKCILHFFDTSRNGTRRWCSMAGCGNRAKASRHYARTREDRP